MNLHVDLGIDRLNKHHEELCGDNVEVVRNGDSTIVVLADGLGSGVKANILSKLTAKILATLMTNGFPMEEAVETIVDTLPVCRERDIAYSTFSILQLHHDGSGYLAEFDNPAMFRLRKGRVLPLDSQTREISGKRIRESRFEVAPGDLFVLVSDGVIHAGVGQSLNLGWQWEHVADYLQKTWRGDLSAKTVSKLLISVCDGLYAGVPGDDTTVVSILARKPVSLSVLVGPPVQAEEDTQVVREFLMREGPHVVCGGTTSQIVARELGAEVETRFDYVNPAIPPIAKIRGIDLATEGVLTLRKTLEQLQACLADGSSMQAYLALGNRDGASRLAKMLLEDCTDVCFWVGRAMNPAHQNPDFPLNLGLKLKLVEEIAGTLRQAGKQVDVRYH